jgi:hypothetical protein
LIIFISNEIEKIDGQPVYHQRVDVPIPFVDPRSMLIKAYALPLENGHIFFLSSKDTVNLVDKYKTRLGKDVVGTLNINFWRFLVSEDG